MPGRRIAVPRRPAAAGGVADPGTQTRSDAGIRFCPLLSPETYAGTDLHCRAERTFATSPRSVPALRLNSKIECCRKRHQPGSCADFSFTTCRKSNALKARGFATAALARRAALPVSQRIRDHARSRGWLKTGWLRDQRLPGGLTTLIRLNGRGLELQRRIRQSSMPRSLGNSRNRRLASCWRYQARCRQGASPSRSPNFRRELRLHRRAKQPWHSAPSCAWPRTGARRDREAPLLPSPSAFRRIRNRPSPD